MKLSSVKADSRFTTASQIVKLSGSYEVSRIVLKISEIKRTKMARKIDLCYSNKPVQSVVDMKNRPDIWSKAKRFNLSAGQNELRMDFAVPIVACNLLFDYVDFYESQTSAAETLQCPRCSASVPAQPGVCGNCGENVYQCHKCRSINYDERDPFLW
jgi:E3 ubiquitin-protein ligase UBR4